MPARSEDKKRLDDLLTGLQETSQRSLVSLRKEDLDQLSLDIDKLGDAITSFMVEVGADLLPRN